MRAPRHPCAWVGTCPELAFKERWRASPQPGRWVPSCPKHCAPATPIELQALGAKDPA